MSAYGITLRAIIANLFGLPKRDDEQPVVNAEAAGARYPTDDQLTVPGYYVASPEPAPEPITSRATSSARG